MAERIREVMTRNPVLLEASTSVTDAARAMRDRDIGDVLVQKDGALCGIVTDRDLVIRCLAEGHDPQSETLGELCSRELATLQADASVDEAVDLMKQHAIRRVPVIEGGSPIGIVSLGDLAQDRDPQSALGRISTAPARA